MTVVRTFLGRQVHDERAFDSRPLADTWADFMASAGYVVEIKEES